MNIAIFASAFYPHVGGVEELCRQLAHQYLRLGQGVIVVTNQWPPKLAEEEGYEGINVYRLPMHVPAGAVKARVKYWLNGAAVRRRLLAILRRHEIDVVHVQCVSTNAYYALLVKRELGLPLVVTAQGERTMDADRIYQRWPYMNRLLREVLGQADWVTACSQQTLDDLLEFYGPGLGDKSSVVYNGVDLSEFSGEGNAGARQAPYILAIGRHVPQKGFDILLRAYAQSQAGDHDLVVAGEGPETERLKLLANELGIAHRVDFVGRAERAKAVQLFQNCSFFVLPSRHEPLGIVNLEAMAAGKAVVASRVGGVPEIVIGDRTGILVPGEDVSALARALTHVAGDAALRAELGRAGRERASLFSWDDVAMQYLGIYERSVGVDRVGVHSAADNDRASDPLLERR